jgi:adenylate cyclase
MPPIWHTAIVSDGLSIDDLVEQAGESAETLLGWQALGLLGRAGDSEYSEQDVLQARVMRIVLRRGVDLEVVARLERENPFLDREVERLFPAGLQPRYSIEEAAERAGVDLSMAERFSKAGNLLDEDGMLDDADVVALRGATRVIIAGLPEDALLQIFRVFADVTDRASQGAMRAFHMYVHQRFLASGMAPDSAQAATTAVTQYTRPATEPTLLYFFRKAQAKALRDDAALHVAEDAGLSSIPDVPGEVSRAVMFVDLSSFTPLTEAMGDRAAAVVLERLSSLVRDATGRAQGHVVKQSGDGFMLVFRDGASAVIAALEIEEGISSEPQFPAAHSGIHFGRVLYREGDYVGAVVNLASRLSGEAGRHQIVVTAEVRAAAKGLADVQFAALGKRRLKGVADAVELFEVRRLQQGRTARTIDPVCGMELGPGEAVARLMLAGAERTFCSDNCLRLFVETPERYAGRSGEAIS